MARPAGRAAPGPGLEGEGLALPSLRAGRERRDCRVRLLAGREGGRAGDGRSWLRRRRCGGAGALQRVQPRGRVVAGAEALNQGHVTRDVIGAQPQNRLVGGRVVPGTRLGEAEELDQHQAARPRPPPALRPGAVDDEAAREGGEGGLNALQVRTDVGVGAGAVDVGESVSLSFNVRLRTGGSGDHSFGCSRDGGAAFA